MASDRLSEVRPEINALLARLRRRIRRYVLLEGLALVLVVMGLLFWFSLGINWAYFQVSNLELPRWFRATFVIVSLCVVAAGLLVWVLHRFVRRMQARALALVLERRFPELDDRLITAVEVAESTSGRETPLTLEMLRRTVDAVTEATRRLEISDVFQKAPLRRAVLGATVLVVSIVAFGLINSDAMAGWWKAYVGLEDVYWDRDTQLVAKVIAEPGDRLREFVESEDGYDYKHPKGGDLTLLVEVPETNEQGKRMIVPERIELRYRLANGSGTGSVLLSAGGENGRQYKHTLAGVQEDVQLWVRGGDFVNRKPYRVAAVDQPKLDAVVLECDYPDYTGLDQQSGMPRRVVQGAQISLPLETAFVMRAQTNKPLVRARLQTEVFEIDLAEQGSTLTIFPQEGEPQRKMALSGAAGLGESEFHLPLVLTSRAGDRLARYSAGDPVPFAADTQFRIYLEDTDEIMSIEPARLAINGIEDRPPEIATELRGIGEMITRRATIPVAGTIRDDYGIAKARFEYQTGDDAEWIARGFRRDPQGNPREFVLQRDDEQPVEHFDVTDLSLELGEKLTLSVYAEDGDDLNGPHRSRGKPSYTFTIVSNEELLSILYQKELNLRRRFEQIIAEVKETQEDLNAALEKVGERERLRQEAGDDSNRQEEIANLTMAIAVTGERSIHKANKNAGESKDIEVRFDDILQELVNNAVHTRQMVERIEGLIVKPLRNINDVDFSEVDLALGAFKVANEQGDDPTAELEHSLEQIAIMLEHMERVLSEMEDLATFHEAIADLQNIIEAQQDVKDQTEKKRLDSIKTLLE